jgi:hypothetical protein
MSKKEIKLTNEEINNLNETLENYKSILLATVHDLQVLFSSMLNNPLHFDQELADILLKFETKVIKNMNKYLMKSMGGIN